MSKKTIQQLADERNELISRIKFELEADYRVRLSDKLRLYGVVSGSGDEFDVAMIPFREETLDHSLAIVDVVVAECDDQFQSWFDENDRSKPLPSYLEYWEGCDLYVELPNGDLYEIACGEDGTTTRGWKRID